MDIIIHKFTVDRGHGFIQTYPFTTYDCIWKPQTSPLLEKLFAYFRTLFVDGVPRNVGKKSVSGARQLIIQTERRACDLTKFAQESDYVNREKYQHQVLQNYLLHNDAATIAIEIPVWDDEYRGHIDGIRIIDNKLHVFDFKPDAAQEIKAASQVYRYRHLLSVRTGIPENEMIGCYFDNKNTYFLTI